MALNIRFVAIAVVGALAVGGVATAAELAGPARPGAVVTADGTTVDGPQQPADANAVVVGPSVPPSPAPSGSPTSTEPPHSDTWGWG
ncbi:hypothetical protein [Streptomyces sp. TLI_171]|uniref:hypothetical protein n=1 Tax=Streptomyces sp. TLI_171 TaxID=1938859 RepID=UPI000C4C116C|nr:hypothetical protein [Streptomyces sp. TLI_171]RKE20751.1 hypothetical protein BX266_4122 [Streptomyces sp. TLI_171]